MANCGASAVFEVACGLGKSLTHKNWRVREGVLALYAQAVTESLRAGSAHAPAAVAVLLSAGAELVLPHAAALLSDARPELRKAAVDACAAQALREGLPRVTARAEKAGARAAHIKAVEERLAELRAAGGGQGAAEAPAAAASAGSALGATGGSLASAGGGSRARASSASAAAPAPLAAAAAGPHYASVEDALLADLQESNGEGGGSAASAPPPPSHPCTTALPPPPPAPAQSSGRPT